MKKTLAIVALGLAAVSSYAQGYIDFSDFTVPITIGSPANPGVTGQYIGSDYSVQAYMALGSVADANALSAVASTLSSFIGATGGNPGVDGAGLFGLGGVDTGMAIGQYTIQIRAWYNGGLYSTYDAALAAGKNVGSSGLYSITSVSSTSPNYPSVDSLNMAAFTVQAVPEPTTFALAGLGSAALLIFRRRK